MKNRRILVILLSVIFAAILVFVFFFTFTVKKVDVTFSVYNDDGGETAVLKEKFDKYVGKNLLFFNEKEIEDIVAEHPMFEVKSVEKNYPDGIDISIIERKEVYTFAFEDKNYILSEDGKVIKERDEKESGLVKLSVENFGITEVKLGDVLPTEYKESLANVFNIAKTIKVSDKATEMKVERKLSTKDPDELGVYETVILLSALTEVDVTVWNSDLGGEEKSVAVFDKFDSLSDYEKSFYDLEVDYDSEGKIVIIWTKDGKNEVIS